MQHPSKQDNQMKQGAVAAVLVLGVVAGLSGCARAASGVARPPSSAFSAVASAPAAVPVVGTSSPAAPTGLAASNPPPATGHAAAPPGGVTARVKAFTTALVHTKGESREAWLAALAPFCASTYLPQLALVDPSQIPAQTVTGAPQLRVALGLGSSTYWVPTSTQGFTVTVTDGGRGGAQVVAAHPGKDTNSSAQN